MAGTKKRKHAVAEDQQTSKHTPSKTQTGIEAFASVSKSHGSDSIIKKQKTVHERESTPPAITLMRPTPSKPETKRKRSQSVDNSSDVEAAAQIVEPRDGDSALHKRSDVKLPRSKRIKSALPPSPAETPSKRTAALFDKLKLDPISSAIPFSMTKQTSAYDTPPETPESEKQIIDLSLPIELQELAQIHAAFLTALSIYYAHNGTSSPVDVQALLPLITKNWKKRSVTVHDLRRLLAIDQKSGQSFFLEDYGRAGVYLSRAEPRGRALKRAASYIDEDELNGRFEEALQQHWLRWRASAEEENRNAGTFIDQLSLAEITRNESAEKAAPLFARGQQRLADLKAGQAAAKQETAKSSSTEITAEHKTTQAVQSRGTSLLDRILAKQTLTASMPAGPTKEQLERKAALHRIEDVARVLELLAAGKPRLSFSMEAMIQRLQQSLRNPISREEVERCMDLMAKEITPGFVSVIMNGAVKCVVVSKAGRVGPEELRVRLKEAGA